MCNELTFCYPSATSLHRVASRSITVSYSSCLFDTQNMKLLNYLVCAFGLASLASANPSWKLDKSCQVAGKPGIPSH